MLFVSVSPELEIVIRPDIPGMRVNTHGMAESYTVQPALYARFKPKSLDFNQRLRADIRFRQISHTPYGAVPYSDNGIMGSQFAEEDIHPSMPESYVGFNPIHMLGKFDTATDIVATGQPESPAELRKMVEEKLLADSSFNGPQGFILLDDVTIEKPWPTYPLEGQGRHKTIAATVKQLGLNPLDVIAFEQAQEKPGAGVISELEALIAERQAEKDEQDALGAVIPG